MARNVSEKAVVGGSPTNEQQRSRWTAEEVVSEECECSGERGVEVEHALDGGMIASVDKSARLELTVVGKDGAIIGVAALLIKAFSGLE